MSKNRFSLLIPVYAHPNFFQELLSSIEPQIGLVEQCILVDEKYSKETSNLIDNFARNHPAQVQVFRPSSPLGISGATQLGLKKIRSEYVALIDSDDLVSEGAFAEIQNVIDRNPDVQIISSQFRFLDSTSGRTWTRKRQDSSSLNWNSLVVSDNYISHLKVVKRSLMNEVSWNPLADGVQDAILNFSCDPKSQVVLIPKILYTHRLHSGQHSRQISTSAARLLNSARKAWISRAFSRDRIANVENFESYDFRTFLESKISKRKFGAFVASNPEEIFVFNSRKKLEDFSKRGMHLIFNVKRIGNPATKIIRELLNLAPASVGLYLDCKSPEAWRLAIHYSGCFDYIYLDNPLLLPALQPYTPKEVPLIARGIASGQ